MKKIITKALLSLLILCMLSGSLAMASDDALTVLPSFNVETGELVIAGTIEWDRGNIPVVMTFMQGDTLIDAQQTISAPSNNGISEFKFDAIPFDNTTPSGDYNIYVSADYIGVSVSEVYTYDGADRRFEALNAINSAIKAESETSLIAALSIGKGFICEGDEVLFDSSEDAQKNFAQRMIEKGTYTQPENYETDENVKIINDSLALISANYKELLLYAEAVDINSELKLDAWLTKYAEANGFYDEDEATDYSENELIEYFNDARDIASFYERIPSLAIGAEDFSELRADMLISAVLTVAQEANYYELREITEELSSLFDLDTSDFDKLGDAKQTEVYQILSQQTFDSLSDFSEDFDDAVEEASNSDSKGSSSGRGSSSKGGTSYIPVSGNTAVGTPQTAEVFNDLSGFAWAKTAIEALSSRGIISGRGAGLFDPAAQVTRAEFVKMVVKAFGIPVAQYNGSFEDVSVGSWYAEYVQAASSSGLVTGVDATHFVPDAPISRQDMIVLLYRAKNFTPSSNAKDVFTDSYAISDYAKSAVYTLYEKGMISGSGNGTLEPLRSASRAEAAQMIYNIIR